MREMCTCEVLIVEFKNPNSRGRLRSQKVDNFVVLIVQHRPVLLYSNRSKLPRNRYQFILVGVRSYAVAEYPDVVIISI